MILFFACHNRYGLMNCSRHDPVIKRRCCMGASSTHCPGVETFIGQDVSDLQAEINRCATGRFPVAIRAANTSATLAQTVRVAQWNSVQQAVATGHGTGVLPTNVVSLPTTARQLTACLLTPCPSVFETDLIQRAAAWLTPTRHRHRRSVSWSGTNRYNAATAHSPKPRSILAGHFGRSPEMLPFLREQSVTMPAHRFGTFNDLPQRPGRHSVWSDTIR